MPNTAFAARCTVIRIVLADHIDKRQLRFMGPGAAYNFMAMEQAIADSGLDPHEVSNERTGLIMGSGGPSTSNFFLAHNIVKEKGSPANAWGRSW
jgi:3-oxoacyl-[acyl-carrier-protein] synthase-1